eukprot:3566483-Rhodomonas_salina.5
MASGMMVLPATPRASPSTLKRELCPSPSTETLCAHSMDWYALPAPDLAHGATRCACRGPSRTRGSHRPLTWHALCNVRG